MSRFLRQSVALDFGRQADADIIYYNASIQSTNATDTVPKYDPQVVFQETRSQPLINDAEDFQFSIVRFALNGANKSCPLWIPRIQEQATTPPGTVQVGQGVAMTVNPLGGTPAQIISGALPNNLQCLQNTSGQLVVSYKNNVPPAQQVPFDLKISGALATQCGFSVGNAPFNGSGSASYTGSAGSVVFGGSADTTIYSVTMTAKFGATVYTSDETFLIWFPDNVNTPAPPPPYNKQDFSSDYYYSYSFDKFCVMFNSAVQVAVDDAWAKAIAGGETLPANPPQGFYPFLKYDPATRLFSAYALAESWGAGALDATTQGQWNFFMNTNLEGLLSNWDTDYYSANTVPGLFNELQFYDKSGPSGQRINTVLLPPTTSGPTPPTQQLYWVNTQNYPSTGSIWSPVDAIVFTSSFIPVAKEQMGTPYVFVTDNVGYANPVSPSAFQQIIGDVQIDLSSGAQAGREFILYNPTAEYRMSDMSRTNSEIRNLDIQVWWRNRYDNNLYPLRLTNNASASFKFMFRRRGA